MSQSHKTTYGPAVPPSSTSSCIGSAESPALEGRGKGGRSGYEVSNIHSTDTAHPTEWPNSSRGSELATHSRCSTSAATLPGRHVRYLANGEMDPSCGEAKYRVALNKAMKDAEDARQDWVQERVKQGTYNAPSVRTAKTHLDAAEAALKRIQDGAEE